MDASGNVRIPNRAETLKVLRLMGGHRPMLMLCGDDDGYGARWTIDGQQIQPAIATYLMKSGYIVDTGATEMGARTLALSESGVRFRTDGLAWWGGLGLFEKLGIVVFG